MPLHAPQGFRNNHANFSLLPNVYLHLFAAHLPSARGKRNQMVQNLVHPCRYARSFDSGSNSVCFYRGWYSQKGTVISLQ